MYFVIFFVAILHRRKPVVDAKFSCLKLRNLSKNCNYSGNISCKLQFMKHYANEVLCSMGSMKYI